jgi:hypothetical protein
MAMARLKSKQEADMSQFEDARIQLTETLRGQRGGDFLNSFVYGKLKEFDPNDKIRQRVAAVVAGPTQAQQ